MSLTGRPLSQHSPSTTVVAGRQAAIGQERTVNGDAESGALIRHRGR